MSDAFENLQRPMPTGPQPDGSVIGDFDASLNPPENPEILHRPHAFALIHGNKGAKVAYGELHWRVDAFTLQFKTSAIAVADHADHAHEHDHTHAVSGTTGSGPTGSGSDTVTTAINDATTGNVNASSGTVTTSGVSSGTTYDNSHTHTAGVGSHTHEHDHTHTIPSHQHSFADTSDSPNEATTSGVKDTDGSTYGSGSLTHTVSGQITYCSGASQEAIGNITQQVPKYPTEDGTAMDPAINDTKYHELGGYGDVYLCWKADFEKAPAVTKCWVQIGVPADGDPTLAGDAITMGKTTTDRLDETPDDFEEDTYHIKIGTVNKDASVIQKVSSDVVWTPTVMDRIEI